MSSGRCASVQTARAHTYEARCLAAQEEVVKVRSELVAERAQFCAVRNESSDRGVALKAAEAELQLLRAHLEATRHIYGEAGLTRSLDRNSRGSQPTPFLPRHGSGAQAGSSRAFSISV
jgi:hypothetical protein